MQKRRLYFLLLFLFMGGLAVAQDSTLVLLPASELDPVSISATYSPSKVSQTGRNVLVFSGDRFLGLPVHTLDELLRYLPGIEVQSRGPLGAQSDITIRGATFQQVLVIVDGMRVNDPNTGHFTAYIPIAPSEIERIEVLKGASSALYGSEAVGGVITVITKSLAARQNVRQVAAASQLLVGEYGAAIFNGGVFKNNGVTAFSIGAQAITTKGQPQRGIRGFVHSGVLTASVNHYFSKTWQIALRGSYDRRRFAAQNFYTSFISDTAQETITTFWNQLQLVHTTGAGTTRLQAGYKNLQDSFAFNLKTATNQSKSKLWQVLATQEWLVNPKTAVVFGTQVLIKSIASNDRGHHSLTNLAGFVIVNKQVGEHLFLSPALRLERNEISGAELVPQMAAAYRTTNWTMRASAGKTVRDADFTERYNNYNKTLVTSGRIGNPFLQAERSFSYEAGIDYRLSSTAKIATTVFRRQHKKLIDYVATPYSQMPRQENLVATGTYLLAKNIAEVETTGLETDLQWTAMVGKGSVYTVLGLVWLDSETSNGVPSLYVSSAAKFLTNFSVSYRYKGVSLTTNGLYKTRAPQTPATPALAKLSRDYFVMNTKASVAVWQKIDAFVEVNNITDSNYTDLLGAQMPGRWLMGGFKISL